MTTGPSQVDRLDGVNEGIAEKAPVRVRSIGNITLSGEQTIDSVAVVEGDRVLVMAQTDAKENGIYDASTGNWTRSLDANGNRDLVKGSMVFVNAGTTYQATKWYCTSSNPITIDTDNITWAQWSGGGGFPNASYVVVDDEDASLPNNRRATQGSGITMTDGGAGSTLTLAVSTNQRTSEIFIIIGGAGSAIVSGIKGDIFVPFACVIQEAHAFADQSGSIVVDIWMDTYANFPPTDADSITASAPVTISTATKAQDQTLTGWTTTIPAGSILRFNVDSATSITRCTVGLEVLKS